MFDYPLKKREIFIFMGTRETPASFDQALAQLVEAAVIFKIGNFYSLFNNYALAERRSRGNAKADTMLKKAERAAAVIAAFPFVKGVAVSGSLSKKFAGEDADIDFFIITTANRLWIARSFLHLFKKITFLYNQQDSYCMNYFIDEAAPCILEKNIYTATEVATLLPMYGSRIFENFYQANSWIKKFFPNRHMHMTSPKEVPAGWLRFLLEKIFDNKLGDALDNLMMRLTAKSWDAKTRNKKKNNKGMVMGMHAGKHFSKPNPANFQKKLLQRNEKSLLEVMEQYDLQAKIKNNSL